MLHRAGLRYRVNLRIRDPRCIPDVVFTRARIAIFVDGCFWHGCELHGTAPKHNAMWWEEKLDRNRRRDQQIDEALRRAQWHVLRIWEHDDMAAAAATIHKTIRKIAR